MSGLRGEANFTGRVGVIIEVAPNRFYHYVIQADECQLEMEQEVEDDTYLDDTWRMIRSVAPRRMTLNLSGYLTDQRDAERRPEWATETAGEIESRRALGGRS